MKGSLQQEVYRNNQEKTKNIQHEITENTWLYCEIYHLLPKIKANAQTWTSAGHMT